MEELATIQSKIYEIRGQRVMLDRDLAELYGVTTGNLNKAVKRNIERFPERFMFQLTEQEFLIFQNGTSVGAAHENVLMLLPNKGSPCFLPCYAARQPYKSVFGLWMLSSPCATTL